jgi:hypothetical protein
MTDEGRVPRWIKMADTEEGNLVGQEQEMSVDQLLEKQDEGRFGATVARVSGGIAAAPGPSCTGPGPGPDLRTRPTTVRRFLPLRLTEILARTTRDG